MKRYEMDGHLEVITQDSLKRGNVLRWVYRTGETPAFSDSIIVDVIARKDELYVKLSRPYAYVALADTACPTVLTGVETYEVNANRLIGEESRYRVIVQSTGEPANRAT